ncbi:HNH homing endonuclease [Lactococcus phage PMBT68]|nr:HNH homing endonuclease [Lactococcus phage P1411]
MEEIWKDIVGYEGLYLISNLGRVKSIPRIDPRGHQRNGKMLTPELIKGYYRVRLSKNGVKTKLLVHRLVLINFTHDSELQVNHKDENRLNNCLDNLEWMTTKENCNYGTRNQRVAAKCAKKVTNGIMTFDSVCKAAEYCNLHQTTISSALTGKCKTAGGFTWKYI